MEVRSKWQRQGSSCKIRRNDTNLIVLHLPGPGHRKMVIDLTRSDGDNTAIAITVSACQSSI